MKRTILMLLVSAVVATGHADSTNAPTPPDRVFAQAAEAYDQGHFDRSRDLYEALAARGLISPQLYFNLGNAEVRLGRPGPAILAYRRAAWMAPRDPDIRANLKYAIDMAGAVVPAVPPLLRALRQLTMPQWMLVAAICYWSAAVFALLHLLLRGRPRWCLRASAIALAGLVVAAAGVLDRRRLQTHPEAVVLASGAEALFAPLADATTHFKLPEGSVIRVVSRSGEWLKVESGGKTGWLRESACDVVWPPAAIQPRGDAPPVVHSPT